MADFKTHVGVAAIGSGCLSTMCLGAGIAGPAEVVTYTVVGTIGGMLPDIDSDHSSPVKILFTAFGLAAACSVVFGRAMSASIIELWILGVLAYCSVRYLAWLLFTKFTAHRGIFHSLLAALFFWFLTAAATHYALGMEPLSAWTVGFFVFFGFNIHLLLDEAYSVDLSRTQLKRSFGTAFKLFDYRNWKTSALMLGAVFAAYSVTPDPGPFMDMASEAQTYERIADRLLPEVTPTEAFARNAEPDEPSQVLDRLGELAPQAAPIEVLGRLGDMATSAEPRDTLERLDDATLP